MNIGVAFYIVSYGNPYGFWCSIMFCLTKEIICSTVRSFLMSFIMGRYLQMKFANDKGLPLF